MNLGSYVLFHSNVWEGVCARECAHEGAYVGMCKQVQVPSEARRGQPPGATNVVSHLIRVQETELRSSEKVASALNHQALCLLVSFETGCHVSQGGFKLTM